MTAQNPDKSLDDLGIIGVASYALSDTVEREWTKEVVLDRLAEGIVILQRGGRVGPRAFGNAMPTFLVNLDRELGDHYRPSEPLALAPTARQVTLAEQACEWPVRFVEDLRIREALHIWMFGKAIKQPWQKLAVRRGWAKETAKRYKDRAVYHIVTGLIAAGVPVEEAGR